MVEDLWINNGKIFVVLCGVVEKLYCKRGFVLV